MPSKFASSLTLCLVSFFSACSEPSPKAEISKPPAYVTNAEHVLTSLNSNKASAVAFQVKPVRSTACEHMYIEFGKKDAQGGWSLTNVMYPGKDVRDNFGQDELNDQIHFAEIDGPGEFGIIAFGCKPYGQDLKTYKGLMAEFKVDHGKLNYVGEVTLLPAGADFSTVYVVNRSKFARDQIAVQLPELEPYFHENIMEMYLPKLSKEQQAALDDFEVRKKALQPIFDMRNRVKDDYNLSVRQWNDYLNKYGGPNNKNKTAESDRKSLEIFKRKEALEVRLKLHDKFIDEGRSLKYVRKYISLLNDYEKKKAKSQAGPDNENGTNPMFEAADAHDALLTFKRNNP